jgi:hypothetical protein
MAPRYSILYETLRSIDGNQQWQPYGLPYARTSGPHKPAAADERHYGFGPHDVEAHGLPIFIEPTLRRTVFLGLFKPGISGKLATRPELQWPGYKFPECSRNTFPVAFLPEGDAAEQDDGCAVGAASTGPTFVDHLVRFWRAIRIALGQGPSFEADPVTR